MKSTSADTKIFEKFNEFMEGLIPSLETGAGEPCIAVAVSGGADSMALMLLANKWAQLHNLKIIALTVDHRLRAESRYEAAQVAEWAYAYGIEHKTIIWNHEAIQGGMQHKAREARYDLLGQCCKDRGIKILLTAHHNDDQWETFFMRLSKGSGPEGLEGIRPIVSTPHGLIVRPLLSINSSELKLYLEIEGQNYINDPSNENVKFERVRWRVIRDNLPQGILSNTTLNQTMTQIHHQNSFVQRQVKEFLDSAVKIHLLQEGLIYAQMDFEAWQSLDPFLQQQVLRKILHKLSGKPYASSFELIESISKGLLNTQSMQTACGCCLFVQRWKGRKELFITLEPRQLPKIIMHEPRTVSVKWGALKLNLIAQKKELTIAIPSLGKNWIIKQPNYLGLTLEPLNEKFHQRTLTDNMIELAPKKIILSQPSVWCEEKLLWTPFQVMN